MLLQPKHAQPYFRFQFTKARRHPIPLPTGGGGRATTAWDMPQWEHAGENGHYCGTHIVVTAQAWKWCLNEDKASPDLQISGCTTVIQWAGRPQNSARDNNEQVIRFDPLVRDDFPHLPAQYKRVAP